MAYQWLTQQRKHYPANADIWTFRRDWAGNRKQLLETICSGNYVFSPLTRVVKQDALVLKVLPELLSDELNLAKSCMHVKGHGGLKQCVASVQQQLKDYQFVCKTDVKSFYESIDQYLLIEQIHQHIDSKILKRYLYQVAHRTVECGGNYQNIHQGISRGCPLSPLLGALYLKALDDMH